MSERPFSLSGACYQEAHGWPWDEAMREQLQRLIKRQRLAAREARERFVPSADAEPVSAAALERLLADGVEVHGLASEREITNALPFNDANVVDTIRDRGLARRRRQVDVELARRLGSLFGEGENPTLAPTGQYWYPPGAHMGWHTNSRFPGWRLYITHAPRPDRSFFRYRHPVDGSVRTSIDADWSLRLFRVSVEQPLWHCVRAEADRFSLGYLIRPATPRTRAIRLARRLAAYAERALPSAASPRAG